LQRDLAHEIVITPGDFSRGRENRGAKAMRSQIDILLATALLSAASVAAVILAWM